MNHLSTKHDLFLLVNYPQVDFHFLESGRELFDQLMSTDLSVFALSKISLPVVYDYINCMKLFLFLIWMPGKKKSYKGMTCKYSVNICANSFLQNM